MAVTGTQKFTHFNRNQLVYLVVAIVLVVAWCAFIFYMSARPSDESSAISGHFSFRLLSLLWHDFNALPVVDQQYWCDAIDYPIRKAAHFTEYTLLGLLVTNLLTRVKIYISKSPHAQLSFKGYVFAWVSATLYAVTDEIHQLFVPGRACLPTDVLIDSAGVLLGVLVFAFVSRIVIKRRNQRSQKN